MKKITIILFVLLLGFLVKAQVINVCGTDSVRLTVDNYVNGTIEWQESIDTLSWANIPEVSGIIYRFLPTQTKYYRAVVKTSDCQPLYSAISLVQLIPIANAGTDRTIGTTSMSLLANYIPGAVGEWTILSGSGGVLDNNSNPKALLTGINNETYKLKWTLTNACGQSSDTVQISFNQLDAKTNFIVVDNTDSIFSDNTQIANGVYRIKFSDPNISPVDSVILIGMRQDISFLRKVDSFTLQDSVYTFITEQGTFQDLFKSGVINIGDAVNQSMSSTSSLSKIKSAKTFPTRKTLEEYKNSKDIQLLYVSQDSANGLQKVKSASSGTDETAFTLKIDDQTLLKNDDESFTFSIKDAYIKVTPRFLLDFKFEWFAKLTDLRIGVDNAEFEFNMATEMVCSKALSCSPKKSLNVINHHIYFTVGLIPVDVLVAFNINATSDFYFGGAIKYEQTKNIKQNLTAIAEGDRQNNYNLNLNTPSPIITNKENFSTKAEINAEVKIGPKISFLVYGIAGPYLEIKAKLNASACINNNLNWDVNAGVGFEGNLGASGDIIIKKSWYNPEMSLKLFDINYPLFSNAFSKSIKLPYKLELLSGNFQSGTSGTALSKPISLKVVSDWGFGVPFVPVRLALEAGNGSVPQNVLYTDVLGNVSFNWTLGSNPQNKLKVSVLDCDDNDIENSPMYVYANAASQSTDCTNSSLSIDMKTANGYMSPSVTGGTAPYTFSTNGTDYSATKPQFNILIPLKQTLFVKDKNLCIRSKTFEIKVVDACASSTLSMDVLVQPDILSITGKGGKTPYLFAVDNTSSFTATSTYYKLSAGKHTVYIKDANGCMVSHDVVIDNVATMASIRASYPADGATSIPLSPNTFQWTAATYAANQLYDLYLKKGTDAYSLIASNLSSTSYAYSTALVASTTYTWKVAVKTGSTVIDYSEFTFTTASGVATAPTVPVLLQPGNGGTAYSPVTLKWTAQAGDFKYDLYLDANNASTLVALNLTNSEYAINNLVSGKTYYWKVKIKSSINGATATSAVWSFTINNSGTVTDIDGNVYHTIQIGTQTWMVENLKTTHYRNGDAIGTTTPATKDISSESAPKYQWAYNGDEKLAAKYGRLYTGYAATDSRNIAPVGWHVPTAGEWSTLQYYLIANGYNYDGTTTDNKIAKSLAATTDWYSYTGTGAIGNGLTKNNTSGFTALPGGSRDGYGGVFWGIGSYGNWWSSTDGTAADALGTHLFYDDYFLYWYKESKSTGYSVRCVKDEANTSDIQTVNIPAGTFTMGSPTTEVNHYSDETQHTVTLTAFRISKYEITNAQYADFLNAKGIGSNGLYAETLIYASSGSNDFGLHYSSSQWIPVTGYESNPVINVTWYGATEYATYVGGTLPTEAQWEYACRAGTTTPFNTGSCLTNTQANYLWSHPYSTCTNTVTTPLSKTQPVGTYAPNGYGLYDMHGNVWQWCSDWYGTYPTTAQNNPTGPATGPGRVGRGSCWSNFAQDCRSAHRGYGYPNDDYYGAGFRVVFVP